MIKIILDKKNIFKKITYLTTAIFLVFFILPIKSHVMAAFPQVAATQNSSRGSAAVDDSVTLPASIAAGDLIIVFHYSDSGVTRTFPSPWVEIKDTDTAADNSDVGIAYLIASGGESSVTVSKNTSERFSAIAIRITAASWHGTTPPEISVDGTGTSTSPDPASVTASWGSDDNLFIAAMAFDDGSGVNSVSGYPTNYSSNQTVSDVVSSAGRGAIATRELAAASDNPGTFTMTSDQWWAGTLVVRPVPPPTSTPTPDPAKALYIGMDTDTTSNGWTGFIDSAAIYDYALTDTQAKTSYYISTAARFGGSTTDKTTEGLMGYWKMDENTGTSTTADSSGNNLTGTMSGIASTAWSAGKFGSALTFDGTNDEVDVASPASDNLWFSTSQNFTVSLWIKGGTNTAGNTIIRKGNTSKYSYDLSYDTGDNSINFGRYDGTNSPFASGTTAINDSTWHFITGVKNDNTLYLYIDGQLDGTAPDTTTSSLTDPGTNFSMGGRGANYYKGTEDEVRVYNRAFSPSEITALYKWAPGPLGYWKMDENTGTTTADSSGNQYTGTMTAMEGDEWRPGKFGNSIEFGATSEYVSAGDIADPTSQITISAWINWKAIRAYDGIASKRNSTENDGNWVLRSDDAGSGKLQWIIWQSSNQNSVLSTTVMPTNTWTYVTLTFDEDTNTTKMYFNGVLDKTDTTTVTNNLANTADPFIIGYDNQGSSYFDGRIDDVKVYNYVRTQGQIVEDMNASHPLGGSPVGSQIGYWKFDEGYSTVAYDNSINSNSLSLSTASWTTDGKYNMAWNGTGSGYRLSRADDSDFDFTATDDLSIAFWFKSSTASNPGSNQYIVDKETGTGYGVYVDTNGKINFGIDSDGTWTPADTAQSTSDIYDNTWHHVVAIKTGTSKINLYVDGQLQGTDASLSASGNLSNSDSLTVGDQDTTNGNEFTGFIDELKIYRAALTQDQVLVEYNMGRSVVFGKSSTASDGTTADSSAAREYCVPGDTSTCNAPIGEWKLDEGSGTTIYDTSTNGYNLTTSSCGTPVWIPGKFSWALYMDSTNDCVDENDVSMPGLVLTGDVSLSAWVYRRSTTTDDYIIHKDGDGGGSGSNKSYQLYINDTDNILRMAWGYGSDLTYTVNSTVAVDSTNQWVYLAATRNTSTRTVNFYMNGTPMGVGVTYLAANDPTGGAGTPGDFNIGSETNSPSTSFFDGYIDMARVYSYVRSPAQIAWEYNKGKPVVWYKLDECTGSSIHNSAKNANGNSMGFDATLIVGISGANTSIGNCSSGTSTEAWNNGTTGQYSASIDFDGTDDYFTTAGVNFLGGVGSTAPTLSWGGWFYPKVTAASRTLIEKTNKFRLITDSSSRPICDVFVSGAYTSNTAGAANTALNLNTWNHIMCTYNNSTIKYYLNGNLVDSWNQSGSIIEGSTIVYVGQNSSGLQRFRGQVDDVRIYTYPLTPRQVYNDYTFGAVAFK